MANEIKYYNRETEQILIEDEFQKGLLEFLYNKMLGRFLLKTIAARPWFSEMLAKGKRRAKSKKEIAPFIEKYSINISPEELDSFNSFNDFFTRKRAPLPQGNSGELVSVADSKFSYFPISNDLVLKIKGSKYTIKDLLDDEMSAEYFRGGTCLVFRLTVDDNHRYNFIDSGKRLSTKKIRGELHTVRPISEKYDVYTRNSREVSILDTEELGIVAQIEVGALLVGRIVNHDKASFVKNEEKGYFEYGGSTIVVLLNKKLEIDPDIAAMNENGIETKVKAGEKLGLILE